VTRHGHFAPVAAVSGAINGAGFGTGGKNLLNIAGLGSLPTICQRGSG
jgi:hypothetical protein